MKTIPAVDYGTLQPTATRGHAWGEKWEQEDNGHDHVIARSLMGHGVKRQFVVVVVVVGFFCFFPPSLL